MYYPTDQMIFQMAVAPIASINETTATTGGAVCTVIDTQGCKHIMYIVQLGVLGTAYTDCKLFEADLQTSATALTSPVAISGADFSVSPATVPGSTSDGNMWAFSVPITGARKRFQRFNLSTTGTNNTHAILCIKTLLDEAPTTAAKRFPGTSSLGQELVVAG